jgi:hypothetical protein
MRRLLLTLVALLRLLAPGATLPAQQPAPQRQTQTKEQTVYVTRTGKRYHRDGCRYLSQSRIPISLKDAKAKGYTTCKVCRPPQAGIRSGHPKYAEVHQLRDRAYRTVLKTRRLYRAHIQEHGCRVHAHTSRAPADTLTD